MDDRKPVFTTALPRHRYRIGAWEAVLLGDIQSQDGRHYRFALAVLDPVQQQPLLYVTAEAADPHRERGAQVMFLYGEAGREEFETSKDWLEAEAFATRALALVRQRLGIEAEVEQLM